MTIDTLTEEARRFLRLTEQVAQLTATLTAERRATGAEADIEVGRDPVEAARAIRTELVQTHDRLLAAEREVARLTEALAAAERNLTNECSLRVQASDAAFELLRDRDAANALLRQSQDGDTVTEGWKRRRDAHLSRQPAAPTSKGLPYCERCKMLDGARCGICSAARYEYLGQPAAPVHTAAEIAETRAELQALESEVEMLRDAGNGLVLTSQHVFGEDSDCKRCGAFGPNEESEPCQPAVPYGTADESPGFNAAWPLGKPKTAAPAPTESDPVPMVLHCPECKTRHIDEGEFATKVHHTHSCQGCGLTWRPAVVPTVGVQFLPGFRNAPAPTAAEAELAALRERVASAEALLAAEVGRYCVPVSPLARHILEVLRGR